MGGTAPLPSPSWLGLGNGLDGPHTVLLGAAVATGQLSIVWSTVAIALLDVVPLSTVTA